MSTTTRLITFISALLLSQLSWSAAGKDKVTFQLDWLPGGDKAPIYVALEKGYFAEENLDVSISHGRGSTDAISKIATGTADIGLCDLVALLSAKANQPVPVSAVYSVFSKAPYAFYTLQDSHINSVADVKGKKIATSPFTSANVFLPFLLEANGVEQHSITLVKADPGALNPMLITGNADVVISWITDTVRNTAQAREAGKSMTVIPWHDAGLEFYSTSVIASDRFLKQRPEVAKRFVRAFAKAVNYTWEHPEESAMSVHNRVPEVDVQLAIDTINSIRQLVLNEVSEQHGLGRFDTKRLANTWQWTAKAQQLEVDTFDPESAVLRHFFPGE